MNKPLVITTIIILILVGGFFLLINSNTKTSLSNNQNNEDSLKITGEAKTFTLTGENFKFIQDEKENPTITVNEGDLVRIEFKSTSGFHDWVVEEFNVATSKVADGESTSIAFIADKKGTFEYYCSVGQHRANGMKGNLIVE